MRQCKNQGKNLNIVKLIATNNCSQTIVITNPKVQTREMYILNKAHASKTKYN